MKTNLITLLLLIVFIPTLSAQDPQAKWVDQSDDLPGMSDGNGLLIAGAVVATAAVVALIIITKKNKKQEVATIGNNEFPNLGLKTVQTPATVYNKAYNASELSPVQVIAGVNQIPNQQLSSNLALSVGVRFKF